MADLKNRLDQFPTQLVLTILWIVIGIPVCILLRNSILWISIMSVYAIITSHWAAHLAWRAERKSLTTEE